MRVAITGGRGRLAPLAAKFLDGRGFATVLFLAHGRGRIRVAGGFARRIAGFDAILHCAWSSVPFTAEKDPGSTASLDLPLLEKILEARGKVPLVFLSTAAVYGNTGGAPATEETAPNPVGGYAAGKLLAEAALAGSAAILRVSNLIGERSDPQRPQGVLPRLIDAALRGGEITIWGDGHATKDYLHCNDLMSAIEKVLRSRLNGTFNVASGFSASVLDLIAMVEEATERKVARSHVPRVRLGRQILAHLQRQAAARDRLEARVHRARRGARGRGTIRGGRAMNVWFTAGDRHGWAIDEDLRLLREALRGTAAETSLASAEVVHSPFWMALDQIEPSSSRNGS